MPSLGRTYLATPVPPREQSHRRAVLLGIAGLIIFSTSPVFGHHIAGRADTLLAGTDHLWFLCLVAMHMLLAPVHLLFHVLLLTGVAYAVWDRARAWRRARCSLAVLEARVPAPAGVFWRAARSAGIDPSRLRIVHGLPAPAFTTGWVRPRIYVAHELAEYLSEQELAAVLAHETAHVRHHDPLKRSLLRGLSLVLWWIPALRRLADDVADEAEIRADDAAARDDPLVLASAILSLAAWRGDSASSAAAVGFQRVDLLDRRIRRLAGEAAPVGTHLTRRSLAGAAAVLAMVWLSGIMMAHPLPSATPSHPMADHCEHHHELAILHLFCAGFGSPDAGPCPHAGIRGS